MRRRLRSICAEGALHLGKCGGGSTRFVPVWCAQRVLHHWRDRQRPRVLHLDPKLRPTLLMRPVLRLVLRLGLRNNQARLPTALVAHLIISCVVSNAALGHPCLECGGRNSKERGQSLMSDRIRPSSAMRQPATPHDGDRGHATRVRASRALVSELLPIEWAYDHMQG